MPLFTPILALLLYCAASSAGGPELSRHPQALKVAGETWTMTVPQGLQLELLTDRLDAPRLMTFLPNRDLIIGSRSGKVYRLPPPYSRPEVLVTLSDYPHSVAYRPGELLIAKTDGLYRAPYQPGQQHIARDAVELYAALPEGGGHSSRTVAIGPDNRVYVSLGISGNCPDEYLDDSYHFDDRRGGVLLLDESGEQPQWEPFASGLRNPVGLDWHPVTHILYASNNGPDHLGYEQPPEYFAQLLPGSFHGMPWFQYDGTLLHRDTCISSSPPRPREEVSPPVAAFPARNAPMGVVFVPAGALDARFSNNAIVALKGSWGTRPSGDISGSKATRRPPRVMMVQFQDGTANGAFDIISGFQRPDGTRLARPTGVAIGPDGALYFTSDTHTQGLFRLHSSAPGE